MKVILEMRRCTLNLISMFLMVHYTTVTQTMLINKTVREPYLTTTYLFYMVFDNFMWSYHDNVGGAYIKTTMDLNIDK